MAERAQANTRRFIRKRAGPSLPEGPRHLRRTPDLWPCAVQEAPDRVGDGRSSVRCSPCRSPAQYLADEKSRFPCSSAAKTAALQIGPRRTILGHERRSRCRGQAGVPVSADETTARDEHRASAGPVRTRPLSELKREPVL